MGLTSCRGSSSLVGTSGSSAGDEAEDEGGCGCRTPGGSPFAPHAGWLALVGLGLPPAIKATCDAPAGHGWWLHDDYEVCAGPLR